MPRRRPYHSLLHRDGPGRPWGVVFGDYSRALVISERDFYALSTGVRVGRRNQKIITTPSSEQSSIDGVVEGLNVGTRDPYQGLDPSVVELFRSMERAR